MHTLFIRITHWINALAIIIMIGSGWKIYNASPIWEFEFPASITIGGWLGGALSIHFAMMWVLVINGILYLIYSVTTGHLWNNMLWFTPSSIYRRAKFKMSYILAHEKGEYNIIQRIMYIAVISDIVLLILSGISIWKPVQVSDLTNIFGGYDNARIVHFYAMVFIVVFIILHAAAAFMVRGTIWSMIVGHTGEKDA